MNNARSRDGNATAEMAGAALAARVLTGDRAVGARLIRDLDDDQPAANSALAMLLPAADKAFVVGVTGPPGAGKSTLIDVLIAAYRERGARVGVLAVDPSSPISGGALLGDRIRMQRHATDPGVFIRSFATRGAMGGLSRSVYDAVVVLDSMGFHTIFVETVGVGQDEVDVAAAADLTLVVTVPGLGDGVQAIKAGVFEVADVLVVNKADLPGADTVVRDLQAMVEIRQSGRQDVAIVKTVAGEGKGIYELVGIIEQERARPEAALKRDIRRLSRIQSRIRGLVQRRMDEALDAAAGNKTGWSDLAYSVLDGGRTLDAIVDELTQHVLGGSSSGR
ncbi:MAG: methylmalonyl Co-A mutase-associated GTPase MeaB [Deltaproteobacteria bacterium]|nr:methylmalonyl Co-A mutase-associated GTPase MeaB [Deltaproteobacteria bacterium]